MLENDLFDDLVDDVPVDQDDQTAQEPVPTNEPVEPTEPIDEPGDDSDPLPSEGDDDNDDDLITSYLKSRGVKDGKTLVYEKDKQACDELAKQYIDFYWRDAN